MINQNTFDQVVPLAQKLAEKGVNLNTLQGSPLNDVMQTCSTYGLHVEGQSYDELSSGQVNEYLTGQCNTKSDTGYNEHNAVVSGVVDQAGKAVTQSLNFARNVVIPDIKDLVGKIEQVVNGIKAARKEPFVITPSIQSKIFSNPLLLELVERFSNTTAQAVERRELGGLTTEVAMAAIRTGAAQFDAEVEEVLSGDDGCRYQAAQNVVAGSAELENVTPEVALGVHLMCKGLYDNPYDGATMSLVDFNGRLARLVEQSGRIVYQEIERQQRRKKLGLLYIGGVSVMDNRYYINVDNDVYLNMLEQGLTPEALVGNEFLGRRYNDSQLIEKAAELTLVYNREMALREMQSGLEDTNMAREAIERIFALEVVNRADDQLPVDRASLQKRLSARIGLIMEKDLTELSRLVRDLTCHVFYAHTDAHRIICAIDAIGAKNPGIEPREAALLATVEYVAYWVAKQIVVA